VAAVEQRRDDVDGLAEHLVPHVGRRPALADDVLVEVLSGAEPQGEAPVREQADRGRFLRDHGRVVAHDRTRDVCHQLHAFGHLRDRAQHAPGVRRVTLLLEPREVVVAHHLEVEARALGRAGVLHDLAWAGLLGHQRVAEACVAHADAVPERGLRKPRSGKEAALRR